MHATRRAVPAIALATLLLAPLSQAQAGGVDGGGYKPLAEGGWNGGKHPGGSGGSEGGGGHKPASPRTSGGMTSGG